MTPRTAAGRALAADEPRVVTGEHDMLTRVLAIEAEAAAPLRDALRGLDSDEIRAIRARHKAWEDRVGRFGTPSHACVDRGTLLDALATARRALDEVEG